MTAGQGAASGHAEISYASFGRRAAGALIDVLMALVIAYLASAMLVGGLDLTGHFMLLYYWIGNISGQSAGRGMLGVRLIAADGRAPGFLRGTFRTFGMLLSLIPFGAGYLAAIAQAQRRTWHDLLAGTYVVSFASADSIAAGASPAIADADPRAASPPVSAAAGRWCGHCGAALPSAAQSCADCGTAWTAPRLDADIASLAALLHQVARWRDEGTLAAATADALIGRYAALLEALRTPAVSALPERIETPAAIAPTEPEASAPRPDVTVETASPTAAVTVPEPAVAATATPPTPPAPAPVHVRGPSWAEVGIAFLAENTLQVLLYLGAALVLAATFSLTVLAFRAQASIWTLEALLIAGGLAVFGAGVAVRYRRGLRLSGGVLMDIGALFVPLAIGTWAYEAFGARPGSFVVAGVAVEAPLNWLLVGGLTTPLYAILVLRYRLVILAYATTVFAAVAMGSVVWLTAAPWEWRIAVCAILGPVLVAASRWVALRSTDGIEAHLSWSAQGWTPLMALVLAAASLRVVPTGAADLAFATIFGAGALTACAGELLHDPRWSVIHRHAGVLALAGAVLLAVRGLFDPPASQYGPVLGVLALALAAASSAGRRTLLSLWNGHLPAHALGLREVQGALANVSAVLAVLAALVGWGEAGLVGRGDAGYVAATYTLLTLYLAVATLALRQAPIEYAATASAFIAYAALLVSVDMDASRWSPATAAFAFVLALIDAARFRATRTADTPQLLVALVLCAAAAVAGGGAAMVSAGHATIAITLLVPALVRRAVVLEGLASAFLVSALLFGADAAGLPRAWSGAAAAATTVPLVLTGWFRRSGDGAWRDGATFPSLIPALARFLGPETIGAVGAALLALGLGVAFDAPPRAATTMFLLLVAATALARRLHRHVALEWLAVAWALPAIWFGLAAVNLPAARYELALAGSGTLGVAGGYLLRRNAALVIAGWDHWGARLLSPYYVAGYALCALAAVTESPDEGIHAVAQYVTLAGVLAAVPITGSRGPGYLASIGVLLPVQSTVTWLGLGNDVRPLAVLAIAVVGLLGARAMFAPRRGEQRLRDLVLHPAPRPLLAHPVFIGGLFALTWALASGGALAVTDRETLAVPWVFLAAAGVSAAAAVAWRCLLFVHAGAWLLAVAVILLGDRGVLSGAHLATAEQARNVAILGGVYVVIAMVLGRRAPRFTSPLVLAGHVLTIAGASASLVDRATSAGVFDGVAVVTGAAALLAASGRYAPFHEGLDRLLARRPPSLRAAADSLLMYPFIALLTTEVLLRLSLWSVSPHVYGATLTGGAFAYLVAGRLLERAGPWHARAWYVAMSALSLIGPLAAWLDPTWRVATVGASTALYFIAALVFRRVAWLQIALLLTPLWAAMLAHRLELPREWYSAVELALASIYLAASWWHAPGTRRSWLSPMAGPIGAWRGAALVVSVAVATASVGFAAWQPDRVVAPTFAAGAVYYALLARCLAQPVLAYPTVLLAGLAWIAGVRLWPGLPLSARGPALLPAAAMAIAGAVGSLRYGGLAPPALARAIGVRAPHVESVPAACALGALALAAVAAVWSRDGGWALAVSLAGLGATLSVLAAAWRGPLWLFPALAAGEAAYVIAARELGLAGPGNDAAAVWLLPVAAAVTIAGEWAWRREHRVPAAGPPPWWLPLSANALLLLVGSVIATITSTELAPVVMAGYGLLVGGAAQSRRDRRLTGCAVGLAIATVLVVERRLGTPLTTAAIHLAAAGLIVEAAATLGLGVPRALRILDLWGRAILTGGHALAGIALAGAVFAVAKYQVQAGTGATLRALVHDPSGNAVTWVLALAGVQLVVVAWRRRSVRLSYAGLALTEIAYAGQLLRFDIEDPQWFAIPAGLLLFAIGRAEHQQHTPVLPVWLEWAGLGVALGTSLAGGLRLFEGPYATLVYRQVLLAEGLVAAVAGTLLRLRHATLAGVVSTVAALVLLLIEPLRSINQWVVAGAIGVLMIAAGLAAERFRERLRLVTEQMRLTWNRWD